MAEDVEKVTQSAGATGLILNVLKCEIIATNFDIIDNTDPCKDSRDWLTLDVQRHRKLMN